MNLTIHVPNLDRRQDRWYACLGALLALDYPPRCIKRISAHDGNLYVDEDHARHNARQQFQNTRFIAENRLGRHYYCWAWTWYEIVVSISVQPSNSYHLVIIDDWTIKLRFGELWHIVNYVRDGLKMIQFQESNATPKQHTPIGPGSLVDNTPLRHGLTHAGDLVTLFTPDGARDIIQLVNRPQFGTPEWVPYVAGRELDRNGYYSPQSPLGKYLGAEHHINPFQDGRQS